MMPYLNFHELHLNFQKIHLNFRELVSLSVDEDRIRNRCIGGCRGTSGIGVLIVFGVLEILKV